jgi:hypothetical protein
MILADKCFTGLHLHHLLGVRARELLVYGTAERILTPRLYVLSAATRHFSNVAAGWRVVAVSPLKRILRSLLVPHGPLTGSRIPIPDSDPGVGSRSRIPESDL